MFLGDGAAYLDIIRANIAPSELPKLGHADTAENGNGIRGGGGGCLGLGCFEQGFYVGSG